MKTVSVWCTFQVAGFHNWPEASEEFAFLRVKHRHMFHVKVTVMVGHEYRDVEFIYLKKIAQDTMKFSGSVIPDRDELDFGNASCEMLAKELASGLLRYGYAVSEVTVSEDGENGATVKC